GGRSSPHAGHQIAEKLPCGSTNSDGNACPWLRRALRPPAMASAPRPRPTSARIVFARLGNAVSRLTSPSVIFFTPRRGLWLSHTRAESPCQEGMQGAPGGGAVVAPVGEQPLHRRRPGRRGVRGIERRPDGVQREPDPIDQRAVILRRRPPASAA